jgi:uncharacterized protein (UPF0335 family)
MPKNIAVRDLDEDIEDDAHSEIRGKAGQAKDVGGVAGQRLRAFLERIERLEDEKKGLADDVKDIYAEAKGVGFDTKIMKRVIKLRKMEPEKIREEDELLELYKAAIGME